MQAVHEQQQVVVKLWSTSNVGRQYGTLFKLDSSTTKHVKYKYWFVLFGMLLVHMVFCLLAAQTADFSQCNGRVSFCVLH